MCSKRRLVTLALAACIAGALVSSHTLTQQPAQVQPKQTPKEKKKMVVPPGSLTFNTVITKLKAGKQIFSNSVINPDLEAAKKACDGQDFIWIEMQHSTLTWRETQQLIKVVAEAGCIPFVRVPSANVGDILKACDAGALGIVVPMVESVEEARNAVLLRQFWRIGRCLWTAVVGRRVQ